MTGTALIVWRKSYFTDRILRKPVKPSKRSVCGVMVELAQMHRDDPITMGKLEEAFDMANRMQAKLKYYNDREAWSGLRDTDGVTGNRYDEVKKRLSDQLE